MSFKLYLIDRIPVHSIETTARQMQSQPGDWVVDFGAYPFTVWLVTASQTLQDITPTLIEPVDYYQVADQWLRQFTLKSGLHETLSVAGYGFWWTLGSRHFDPPFSGTIGHSFPKIGILHAIRQQREPDAVIVVGPKTPFDGILRQLFPTAAIQYEDDVRKANLRAGGRTIGIRLVRLLISAAYFVYAMIRRPDICILTQSNAMQVTEVNDGTALRDVYFESIAEALRERGWRTTYVEILASLGWRQLLARRWFFPSDAVEIAGHRRLLKRGSFPSRRQRWERLWTEERERICSHMEYNGYDMSDLMLPLVESYFVLIAPRIEIMVSLWRFVLRLWRPKLIFVKHYYGHVAVSMIIAAKSLGIATVEQQHGIIAKHHRTYLPPASLAGRIGFPLCDHLAAWGEHTRRLLVERDVYAPQDVHVCGFSRMDRLALKHPDRSLTLQVLNIPPEAKMILYSASPLVDGYIPSILEGIKNNPDNTDVHWVVKMHPSQRTRALWEEAIDQIGLQCVQVIEGEFDFYALLAACDLHLSFSSTTFIEAALWGKPNLGLTWPYCPDFTGQLEAGAYLPVSFEALGTVVHTLLNDEDAIDALLEKQRAFAQDWCLSNGRSTEYTADAIESILKEKIGLSDVSSQPG